MSVDEESYAFGKAKKQAEEMLKEFNEHAPHGLEHRRLIDDYELKHKWHNHLELPKKKLTDEDMERIRDILEGR